MGTTTASRRRDKVTMAPSKRTSSPTIFSWPTPLPLSYTSGNLHLARVGWWACRIQPISDTRSRPGRSWIGKQPNGPCYSNFVGSLTPSCPETTPPSCESDWGTACRDSQRSRAGDCLGLATSWGSIPTPVRWRLTPENKPPWGGYWADMYVTTSADPSWGEIFMGWPVVPDATQELLLWISRQYSYPLLFIAKNGTAEEENDLQAAQHDVGRQLFSKGICERVGGPSKKEQDWEDTLPGV